MMAYVVRRVLLAIPVLFGITVINFIIINLSPGDPVDMYIDPHTTETEIALKKEQLGLNDPLWVQYFLWLGNMLKGDFGYSFSSYEPVTTILLERIGPTLLLMGAAIAVAYLIAIPIGMISAIRPYSKLDYSITGLSFLGISVPNFFLGLTVIYLFSLHWQLLPSGGMRTLGGDEGIGDLLQHLVLPALVLSTGIAGQMVRYVRASMLEVLGQDYLRTAKAKGVKPFYVVVKHGFRNALIPVITVIGLDISVLIGGSVITEKMFQWPGMGQLTMQAILSRDYPVLMAINLWAAVVVLTVNLITDILYSFADPRIRYR
ncbi:ABC transporter permease [Paenibacillus oceani]|uniref:ABC transporter permease n=1 Tax=Paenibacillus oceani TaxID=2772510 RepID=A0A927CFQ4_9BACL|nr:ABC transporter permease [Paenibacillus oceani]MBD2866112.1 ABC transporter permease [Paenibacillus oceani]